jgi:hypothetical protein
MDKVLPPESTPTTAASTTTTTSRREERDEGDTDYDPLRVGPPRMPGPLPIPGMGPVPDNAPGTTCYVVLTLLFKYAQRTSILLRCMW